MKFNHSLLTDGRGLWSHKSKLVRVIDAYLNYVDDKESPTYGELCVSFDTSTWDVDTDGLIYTDDQFMTELRAALLREGFSADAVNSVTYSEQGMQGDDYVSCDAGKAFMKEAFARGMVCP